MSTQIHSTAEVSPEAHIGRGTRIWHYVQVRENVHIGENCIVGKGAYIDFGVSIGDCCKIQNGCYLYHGSTLEEGVFLGPGVILTNDKRPRAINPDGSLKAVDDWVVGKITIKRGAAIGARSVVLPDVVVGVFSMVGAGSVVTRDVPDYGLVWGNPARLYGFVCPCGARLGRQAEAPADEGAVSMTCPDCGTGVSIPGEVYKQIERMR